MRFQKDTYSCGAAAVVNALRCFGRKVSERRVRAHSNTTYELGTSEEGICDALKALGFRGTPFTITVANEAIDQLADTVGNHAEGNPVIICTQNLQHWVTVIGVTDQGRRYIIADPAKTVRNLHENGVHVLSEKELRKTWVARTSEEGKIYYGIVVSRKGRKRR